MSWSKLEAHNVMSWLHALFYFFYLSYFSFSTRLIFGLIMRDVLSYFFVRLFPDAKSAAVICRRGPGCSFYKSVIPLVFMYWYFFRWPSVKHLNIIVLICMPFWKFTRAIFYLTARLGCLLAAIWCSQALSFGALQIRPPTLTAWR